MKSLIASFAFLCATTSAALALPVNGTGIVTPDVIFGSGNANGSFTGTTENNIELGLRGKVRYDLTGAADNIFNYDGIRTYAFDPAASNAPVNRSAFNFEWTVNSDVNGSAQAPLNTFDYILAIDYDPTANTNFLSFDPINGPFLSTPDHALGTNATGNGAGANATDLADYASKINSLNVAQNSWNLGFFNPPGFDPQTEGMFTIKLSAFFKESEVLAAETSIDIIYGRVPPVPVPASLPLLGAGLLGLGVLGIRRRKSETSAI